MNNNSQPRHSATSRNLGGTRVARYGHSAGNGDAFTASPRGGWTSRRASWLGMAAVVLLAAAILAIGYIAASRPQPSDAATAVTGSEATIATSSTTASPKMIASSWSRGPDEFTSGPIARTLTSGTDVGPDTASSSLVYSPR